MLPTAQGGSYDLSVTEPGRKEPKFVTSLDQVPLKAKVQLWSPGTAAARGGGGGGGGAPPPAFSSLAGAPAQQTPPARQPPGSYAPPQFAAAAKQPSPPQPSALPDFAAAQRMPRAGLAAGAAPPSFSTVAQPRSQPPPQGLPTYTATQPAGGSSPSASSLQAALPSYSGSVGRVGGAGGAGGPGLSPSPAGAGGAGAAPAWGGASKPAAAPQPSFEPPPQPRPQPEGQSGAGRPAWSPPPQPAAQPAGPSAGRVSPTAGFTPSAGNFSTGQSQLSASSVPPTQPYQPPPQPSPPPSATTYSAPSTSSTSSVVLPVGAVPSAGGARADERPVYERSWGELTAEQRQACGVLGYTQTVWDNERSELAVSRLATEEQAAAAAPAPAPPPEEPRVSFQESWNESRGSSSPSLADVAALSGGPQQSVMVAITAHELEVRPHPAPNTPARYTVPGRTPTAGTLQLATNFFFVVHLHNCGPCKSVGLKLTSVSCCGLVQETAGSKKPKMFYSMAIERSAQHTGNGPQAVKKTYSEFLALRYACHPNLNLRSFAKS